MTQYFKFIFHRAGAPFPLKISILQHPQKWANRHVFDDCQFVFANVTVRMISTIDGDDADLLVLPFVDNFLAELPGTVELYKRLRQHRFPTWVLLYGLNYRRIDLVPARQLYQYYRKRQNLICLRECLQRLRLWQFVRVSVRLWNWRWT